MNTGEPDRRVIDGRFELLHRLGGGGMGWVWRARDLALHRDVAVKEVRPPDPALAEYDPEGARTLRERVLREARALARVHHPNVVTIHHIVDGGENTYPWIVMELVTGGSLQDRLQQGVLTPVEAARLGREVLSALRAAHAVGIEHRDVKPANVLLRPDGRPVLTDFGIAALREATSLTATGSVIGSPDFMAPERVSGKDGGPAADLWSLGMLLYVAVEGHHPLRRSSTLATLAAVLAEDVPPPRQAGPLTGLLTTLLVRDPQARPDAEEVDRLLAAVTGEAVHTPVAPPGVFGAPVAPAMGVAAQAPATGFGPAPSAVTGAPHGGPAIAFTGAPTSYPIAPPASLPTQAPAAGDVTVPAAPTPRGPGRIFASTVARAVIGTALTGVLVWAVPQLQDDGGDTGAAAGPSTSASQGGTSSSSSGAQSGGKLDLLTEDGVRTVVKKLKAAAGSSKVTSLVVYPEYAIAEVPVEGSAKLYDRYEYRGGDVAVKDGPGGTVRSGDTPVDLDSFNWDAVPTLLTTAGRSLNISDPTSRYLVINPASTIFDDPPTMNVYLADDYGGAYLEADRNGKVIEAHARDDG
ncbi:serine/threonine-protein kinase [Streptomyces griseoruber]|uniref:non-specific serine/threonine protein kinase n=1 Tax=Streptomyces griseoruber TaxID=1943 RepID=A0A101T5K9_9ACTN|nr:serine/threonine-protein kinase [Streptomyces griseoruber]KUN86140.1 serine/threonine protein kinase [Streptomyces griseoruber]